MEDLKTRIRHVPDFPKAGILFYDITTLLQQTAGLRAAIDQLSSPFDGAGVDLVVRVESRGFVFGGLLSTSQFIAAILAPASVVLWSIRKRKPAVVTSRQTKSVNSKAARPRRPASH